MLDRALPYSLISAWALSDMRTFPPPSINSGDLEPKRLHVLIACSKFISLKFIVYHLGPNHYCHPFKPVPPRTFIKGRFLSYYYVLHTYS